MSERWGVPAPTVPAADFMTQQEAASELSAKIPLTVGVLIARGILEPAFLRGDEEGVTRRSVEAELRWRRETGFWRRLRRRLGGIIHWI